MIRGATVFEYDPGWMEHVSIGNLSDFYKFVDILRKVAPLSGARVKLNVVEPGSVCHTYSLVFVNWTEKSMGDLEAWLRVHPNDDVFLKNSFDMPTIMSELRNLTSGKDRFGYDMPPRFPAAACTDDGHSKTPRILRPVKRETMCTADGVFAGMSLDELVKIVAGIYADPEAGCPMTLTERETGYLAVREVIRRLKVLNATPEKCRPDWLGGCRKEEL